MLGKERKERELKGRAMAYGTGVSPPEGRKVSMMELKDLIEEIGAVAEFINFDNAALSCLPKQAVQAISCFQEERNRSGPQYDSYWKKVNQVRKQVAEKIHASEDEILFMLNTSMAINLAANALPLQAGDNVIVTDLEFPSNIYPWMNLERKGVEVRFVKNDQGCFSPEQFWNLADSRTKAISTSWVISSNGSVVDVARLGHFCREHDIYFIIDGIQGLGALDFDVREIPCDFFVSGFFKWMLGPDGISFAYLRKELLEELSFPWIGWAGMENQFDYNHYHFQPVSAAKRYETGNMNFSAIYGLGASLSCTAGKEKEIQEKVLENTRYLRAGLTSIPSCRVLSDSKRVSGITLFTTADDEKAAARLRARGFAFSCRNGIRLSPHFYNTKKEIDFLLDTLA